jgi:hypothetical protein
MTSWMPVDELLRPELFNGIFSIAKENIHNNENELGTLALSCINEILRRPIAPSHNHAHILNEIFQYLQTILREVNDVIHPSNCEEGYNYYFYNIAITQLLKLFGKFH